MKFFFILSLVFCCSYFQIKAQKNDPLKCENLVKKTYDKVTGETYFSSPKKILISKDGKKGLTVLPIVPGSGENADSVMVIEIMVVGASPCIDEGQEANILFRDGSRLKLFNGGNYNCQGKFSIYLNGFRTQDVYKQLSTKEIETIRVTTAIGGVEEDLTSGVSKKLMKTLECFKSY